LEFLDSSFENLAVRCLQPVDLKRLTQMADPWDIPLLYTKFLLPLERGGFKTSHSNPYLIVNPVTIELLESIF
jgi:hypothetical protein